MEAMLRALSDSAAICRVHASMGAVKFAQLEQCSRIGAICLVPSSACADVVLRQIISRPVEFCCGAM
jgi:hypothetical protein